MDWKKVPDNRKYHLADRNRVMSGIQPQKMKGDNHCSNDVHSVFKCCSNTNSNGVQNIQIFGTIGGELWRNYL